MCRSRTHRLAVFTDLAKRDETLLRKYLSPEDWRQAQRELKPGAAPTDWRHPSPAVQALTNAAYNLWSTQSPIVRNSTLQRLYDGYAVPGPYTTWPPSSKPASSP